MKLASPIRIKKPRIKAESNDLYVFLFFFFQAIFLYLNYRIDGEEDGEESDILSINDQIYLEDTEPKTMYVLVVLFLIIFTNF